MIKLLIFWYCADLDFHWIVLLWYSLDIINKVNFFMSITYKRSKTIQKKSIKATNVNRAIKIINGKPTIVSKK